ncbi:C-type mannose receptor 2-like isoform X12 [Carassius gibelio]|nr:C-type mannose receptor 2-like isoform X10 [Carassius gibelio]XP_052395960.1 C-type mannose receptor 2-like isoform X11 [Carassius gibelio]XP_052395961.1 C-type mannose receptor 2-like isoform X11 [Carassius gibelio]XP_052395962.1 C-type mannose receptor 2-like isoform X12 [Carassius gibelio]
MERITCMSLLLTAVVSSSARAPRQYHFVNQNLSWTEAQSYCREKYTDLFTISDIQEQNDIEQAIKRVNSNADRVWIGLKNTKVGFWSDPVFYTEQYRNWGSDQPGGDGDCVYMNCVNDHKGQWHDVDCNTTRHFICYNASKGFIIVQEQKNWTEAQKYCRESHTDLASVRNQSENEQIQKIIDQNKTSGDQDKRVWIGLHRLWVWSDNSTSTFTHWKPNNNNNNRETCTLIVISDEGQWTDEKCSEEHPFVCYDEKLVLVRENKTWTEALRRCRNMDMDLVSVDSEQMQQRVMNVTSSALSDHVWLGLRHSCTVGIWFWVNGQTVCYDQWASDYDIGLDECDQTVRSGAIRTHDNHWISLPETKEINFICIKYM